MIFPRSFLVALLSATVAFAQDSKPNPPTNTAYSVTAGQPFTLTWTPTTQGTVTLVLRSGASSNLDAGTVIKSGVDNKGSYTWDVPSSEVRGSDYTIEIVSDSDPTQTNYTPYFVLESTNTVASPSLSSVSLGAPTTSLSLSSAPTASPSAFPLQSGITLDTSAHHLTAATTGSASSSGSSSSGASTTGTASSSSTGSSTGSMTTSAHSSTSGQAGLVQTGTSSTHTGGAPRATAMVGMLGAVALGALAL